MYTASKTQPSPINSSQTDREEEDDFLSFCKKRSRENANQSNNAGEDKMTTDAGAIFRSVTTDDDNAPVANDGNADFSTAILMGNISASNSNEVKRAAAPPSQVSSAMQIVSVPNAQQGADGLNSRFKGQMKVPTADAPVSMSTAVDPHQEAPPLPLPLMPITSPLKRQSAPSKSLHSTRAATAAAAAAVTGQEAAKQKYVERWTCDVCKIRTFDTFEEAEAHEISCKIQHDAMKKNVCEDTQQTAQLQETVAPPKRKKKKTQEEEKLQSALTNLVLSAAASSNNQQMTVAGTSRHPNLALIPSAERSHVLSQYNNLLVRNVEFFYPAASHLDYDSLSGSMNGSLMSRSRLGLRCIHCKDSPNHITAAAFFPRTIGSIASGLGTIGTRHFGWGKCPFAKPELVEQMMEAKKTSSTETRARGRMGLDAYCKELASRCGIYDDELSGICWQEGPNLSNLVQMTHSLTSTTSASVMETDHNAVAALLTGMKNSTNIERRSFVPTETKNFWECNGCRMVPLEFRAKGSVVFSAGEPSNDQISRHLSECSGNKPLTIPHNATIEPFYGEQVPPIKVTWNSNSDSPVASVVTSSTARKSRRSSSNVSVKTGTEDGLLCFDEDKEYTTDFAYFTVTQLKKCYLTKEGGSRGSCPLGFPGLACGHCAGTENERRFFYTSADHLRNSFSHIPSHMNECSMCPQEVKDRLEEFKSIRSSQKSSLKVGYHKIFIDRVWDRLHGSGRGFVWKEEPKTNKSIEGGDRIGTRMYSASLANESTNLAVNALVVDEDKHLTTDLIFYTLQQLEPYKPRKQKYGDDEEEREIGFPVREAFDLSSFFGEHSILPLDFLPLLQGLVCKHDCGRKFFTTSSEHLSGLLLTIANHLAICRNCPVPVKTQIVSHQFSHESQLLSKQESHNVFMEEAWRRLVVLSKQKDRKPKPSSRKPAARSERTSIGRTSMGSTSYPTVDPNMALVLPADEQLVTPFTFYTMSQCRPCNLDIKGNGSRSNFEHGFPGLECIHCAGNPCSRKFFYRSADILAGNYAHIPNHLMSCPGAPASLKTTLKELKQQHQVQKHHLTKGTQKRFFQNIWNRLHQESEVGQMADTQMAEI